MAERVVVPVSLIDTVLKERERGWLLVAVVVVVIEQGATLGREVMGRELYFEREER